MCLGFLTYNMRIQIMPGGLSGGVNEMRKIAGSTRVSSTERVAPTFLSLPFPTEIQCLVCQSCVPRSFFSLSDNSTARFPCSSSFLFPGFLFSIPPPPPHRPAVDLAGGDRRQETTACVSPGLLAGSGAGARGSWLSGSSLGGGPWHWRVIAISTDEAQGSFSIWAC